MRFLGLYTEVQQGQVTIWPTTWSSTLFSWGAWLWETRYEDCGSFPIIDLSWTWGYDGQYAVEFCLLGLGVQLSFYWGEAEGTYAS